MVADFKSRWPALFTVKEVHVLYLLIILYAATLCLVLTKNKYMDNVMFSGLSGLSFDIAEVVIKQLVICYSSFLRCIL